MVRGKKNEAAIGSSLAGTIYGVNILAEGIEDNSSNMTRFLVIGTGESDVTGNDKTSLIFATPHSPGSLHSALSSFARRKINLAKIESHPVKDKLWEYSFFVDMIGHITDKHVKSCLQELKKKTTFMKIVGSYPKSEGASMICIPITSRTNKEALRAIERSCLFADIIELRMDLIGKGNLAELISAVRRNSGSIKIIVTCRKKEEAARAGTAARTKSVVKNTAEKIALLKEAIGLGADFIDIELAEGSRAINELKSLCVKKG